MNIIGFAIQIVAILIANLLVMLWNRRRLKKELFDELQIRDDKKNGKYIFVVAIDDFEYDAEVIDEVLKGIGNPYKIYSQEADFISHLPSEPCVYIIDDKLDQANGIDLLKIIVRKNHHNFVILNTGIQNDTLLADYVKHDLDRFVYKDNVDHKKNLRAAIKDGIFAVVNK